MSSSTEIEILLAWDRIAQHFRSLTQRHMKEPKSVKSIAFSQVYGELIKRIVESHLPPEPLVLKTDLWNEGVERDRNIARFVSEASPKAKLVGMDISSTVCRYAKQESKSKIEIIRSTLLSPPFLSNFNFIIDVSTIDHIPEKLRERWILTESTLLKKNGILLISFDCKFNIFCELFHKFFTRNLYPEWTLLPNIVRGQLLKYGFQILEEHAVFVIGLFFGTHKPWFPFARLLNRRMFFIILKKIELSRYSKLLSFIAPQYAIIAVKQID